MIEWRFKVLQAEMGVNNAELGELIGVTAGTVTRYRRHMPQMTDEMLNAICRGLQCQPGDLMKYTEDGE